MWHGAASHAAAVAVESKFTEAARGHVQTADFRNFAHGRHYSLARSPESTAVLAFVTPEDRALATRTLRLLPDGIPVATLDRAHDSTRGSLAGLVIALRVAGLAATARGGDPGRPTVPPPIRPAALPPRRFARPLMPEADLSPQDAAAIEGKAGTGVVNLAARGELGEWRAALAAFRQSLRATSFTAVAFDCDGTLCGTADRGRKGPPTASLET